MPSPLKGVHMRVHGSMAFVCYVLGQPYSIGTQPVQSNIQDSKLCRQHPTKKKQNLSNQCLVLFGSGPSVIEKFKVQREIFGGRVLVGAGDGCPRVVRAHLAQGGGWGAGKGVSVTEP